jgi:hypothetical protein
MNSMAQSRQTRIYGLVDPRDGKVRYVGRTAQPLATRLRGHFYKRHETSTTHRDRWIACLVKMGLKPTIVCLAVVNDNGFEAEKWWIAKLKNLGLDLVNSHKGGGGSIPGARGTSRPMPPEQRARLSASMKGRKTGFAIGLGTPHYLIKTEESEQRRRDHLRGNPASDERKRKARESNLKTWSNPELRRINSERTKLQSQTPEWKEKYREVQTNAWARLTPEQRKERCRRISEGRQRSKKWA